MDEPRSKNRKAILKELIKSLHEGADAVAVKERFKEASTLCMTRVISRIPLLF